MSVKPFEALLKSHLTTIDAYQDGLGRAPTIAEFQELLSQCVNAIAPRLSDGGESYSVSIKPRKRPRKVAIGDVFHGYCDEKNFYGRIIAEVQIGTLLEFYSVPTSRFLTLAQLQVSKPSSCLFRYVHRASFFSQREWRVIGNVPVKKSYPLPIFFLLNGMLDHPKKRLNQRGTPDDIRNLEPAKMYSGPEITESLVKYGLKRAWPDTKQLRRQVLKVQFPKE